jgi:hypothetical protein
MRQVCTRPAIAGSCVITIDHLPKSNEARATGFAIGSIAKKRMIRGAYLRADAKVKPAPGGIGRITLRIEKDTMGELRRSSGGGYAGTLVLDSTDDYALEWSIAATSSPRTTTAPGARPTSWSASPLRRRQRRLHPARHRRRRPRQGAKHIRDAIRSSSTRASSPQPRPRRAWLHTLRDPLPRGRR